MPLLSDKHSESALDTVSTWMVAVAILMEFGLLSMLWNIAASAPPIVWTGIATCLMAGAIGLSLHRMEGLGPLAGPTFAFLAAYPVLCAVSYLMLPGVSSEALDLLGPNVVQMVLGAVLFMFGAAVWWGCAEKAFLLAFLAIIAYVILDYDSFSIQYIYDRFHEDGVSTDYQHLGDAFVICSLMLVSRMRKGWMFAAFTCLSVAVMFIIPSRSAAVLGALCLPIGLLVTLPPRLRMQIVVALITVAFVIKALPLQEIFAGTRFESLVNQEPDGSLMLREEIFSKGLNIIEERPLTGEWAFQLDAFGTSGLYVHNLVDVWVQAGIIGFGLFVFIWLRCLGSWWSLFQRDPPTAGKTLPLLAFAALSWIISRNVAYVLPFFCVGYASAAMVPGAQSASVTVHAPGDPESVGAVDPT